MVMYCSTGFPEPARTPALERAGILELPLHPLIAKVDVVLAGEPVLCADLVSVDLIRLLQRGKRSILDALVEVAFADQLQVVADCVGTGNDATLDVGRIRPRTNSTPVARSIEVRVDLLVAALDSKRA